MKSLGWQVGDAAQFTTNGRMVCNEGLGHAVMWQEIQAQIVDRGHKPLDADLFIYNATAVYRRQYAESSRHEIHQDMLRH